MATTYPMPMWGITMEEGMINQWIVAVGDAVTEGQILGEVGTAKMVVEYESPAAGIVAALLAQEGDTVEVGGGIIVLADDAQDYERYLAENA